MNDTELAKVHISPALITGLLEVFTMPKPEISDSIEEELRKRGLIQDRKEGFGRLDCTPLGDAYVAALCATPPPKQVFVNTEGKIVGANK